MANTVVGFSINIDGVQNIDQLNSAIKDTQKALNGLTVGTEEYAKTAEKLAKLKAEQKGLKKTQDDLNKSFLEQSNALGSYDKASAKLNRLRKEFKDLAVEGKSSSKAAKDLIQEISKLDKELKGIDASVGQYQRNVGNYGDAVKGIADNLGGLGDFAGKAVSGIQAFGAAFKTALGPIGLLIAAIGLVVTAVRAFFNSSEEGQNKFRRLQAIATVVFDNLTDILENLGEIIVNVFENPLKYIQDLGKAIQQNIYNRFVGLLELIPAIGSAIAQVFQGEFAKAGQTAGDALAKVALGVENFTQKATDGFASVNKAFVEFQKITEKEIAIQQKLSDIRDNLDKRERAVLVQNALLQQQVAEARLKASQTDKFTTEERLKFLDEAIAKELQTLQNAEAIAATRLNLRRQEVALDDQSKEALNEIAQLEADLINLRTQNFAETRRIVGQRAELVKQLEAEVKETQQFTENAAKFTQDIVTRTNKVITDLIKNEFEKRRQASKDSFDKELADLNASVEAEKMANQKKLDDLKEKYGEQSKQVKDFETQINSIQQNAINEVANFRTEREKLLQKEILQINKDEIQAQKDLQIKALESNLRLEQETANALIQQKQIQYNKERALLDENKKEDAEKIKELDRKLSEDLYNITKNRLLDEQELIQNQLKNVANLTQQEQEDLNRRLISLKAEETSLFLENEQEKRNAIKETSEEQSAQLQKQIQQAGEFTKLALDTLNGFAEASEQRRLERIAKDEEANQKALDNLNERLQNATGLERRYLEQRIQSEKQNTENIAKEKEKIEKQAAKRRKATAIIESIINTALAISSALATPPAPNVIAATIAGIAGAAQTAVIAAQPLAKGGVVGKGDEIVQFANGGKVTSKGNIKPLSNGDNVLATLKTGEIVLNESQQRRIGYATLKKAQIPNFANGGMVGAPSTLIANSNNSIATEQMRVNLIEEMISATNNRMDRLSVVYTATTDYEVEKSRYDKKTIKVNSTF